MCYCIDRDSGHRRRQEVFNAVCISLNHGVLLPKSSIQFEWPQPGQQNASKQPQYAPQHQIAQEYARPQAPSPGLTESDADIIIRDEPHDPHPSSAAMPYSVCHSKTMEESQTSEGSTMLGLDFV